MTPTFCQHLVEEVEHFGKWSGGKNEVCAARNFCKWASWQIIAKNGAKYWVNILVEPTRLPINGAPLAKYWVTILVEPWMVGSLV